MRKYRSLFLLLLPFMAATLLPTTGCNPYRKGSTVKPVGGAGGKRFHTRPASAKAYKKRKY